MIGQILAIAALVGYFFLVRSMLDGSPQKVITTFLGTMGGVIIGFAFHGQSQSEAALIFLGGAIPTWILAYGSTFIFRVGE